MKMWIELRIIPNDNIIQQQKTLHPRDHLA